MSASDRMTEAMGNSPEPCRNCGLDLWVDEELEAYVDDRFLDSAQHSSDRLEFFYCPGTFDHHKP